MNAARLLPQPSSGLILLFLAFPIVVVVVVSFSSATYLTFPPPAFGLRWYAAYFGSEDWLRPTWLSLWVAAATVVLATFLGTLAALGHRPPAAAAARRGGRADPVAADRAGDRRGDRHLLRLLALRAGRLADRPGAGPYLPRRAVRRDQRQRQPGGHRPRLEQAALSLGATPGGTFFQVTLPLIRPGVLVGALFAFITSFDELVVALFLSGSGAVTLPRRMWDDLRFQIDPTIAAVSTLTIVLTVLLMGCAHLLRRRAERMRTA